jgi:glycosyltransferase involved in cell wall biosynthesis
MSFAYLLESFPDPTKTFVFREVAEAARQGLGPLIYSVRQPSTEERALYEGSTLPVVYLPSEPELRSHVETERASFSARQRRELSRWRNVKGDSTRVFEALWLGRQLRSRGIRHVHAHFAGLAARTAWLLRRLWGISYSFTGHADDIFSPEPREISLGRLADDARFIATETDYSRNRLESEFAAARGKTFRVFNGIGEECFDHRQKITGALVPDPDAPPKIVSVGRLVEKKGFPTLLAASALLRDRGKAFALEVIGAGPLEAALRARVAELHLTAHVTLHGAQPQSFVRARLASARAFALAAQREGDGGSDNLPTVIMEAMASALPVVSTRIAGIPEMVDEGVTGLLVTEGDAPALADALAAYLDDAPRATTHGAEGKIRAREKFGIAASVAALSHLLARHAAVPFPPAAIARDPALRVPWFARLRCWLRR